MTLIDELTAEATNRDMERGWTRQTVDSLPEVRNPELMRPYAQAYLSNQSISVKDSKERRIVAKSVADGELARLYLKRTVKQAVESGGPQMLTRRVPYRREALQFTDRHPAYFFAGQCGGPFELVDITACYASLYTRLTLDLTYRPGTNPPILLVGKASFPRGEEWVQTKSPRNAMWGNLLKPRGTEWRFGEPVADAYPNRFFAPDLMGIVLDAAHAIAIEAVTTFGALSWAVDGGCFHDGQGREFIQWLETSFGLEAQVRAEGLGWLFGATSYSVGSTVTQDVANGRAHEWPEMNRLRKISNRQSRWLGDIFKERSE